MKRVGYTYILTNANNTTLYIGVTADLMKRMEEHINKKFPNSFSAKYNLTTLVWFEGFNHIEEAIAREKQLKAGSRKRKEELVNTINPKWENLYFKIISGEIEV